MKSLRELLKELWRRHFPEPEPRLRKSKYDVFIEGALMMNEYGIFRLHDVAHKSVSNRIGRRGLQQQLQVVKRDDHYCIVRRQG